MGPVEAIALLGFLALVIIVVMVKEQRLADPTNTSTIYVHQMASNHQLRPGPVAASLIRQSGNEYRDLGVFETPEAAISEIVKSLNRAKIDSVAVLKSTPQHYEVVRLHHNHRGKAEGKKLGGAVIVAI